jgi:hypothetical protein
VSNRIEYHPFLSLIKHVISMALVTPAAMNEENINSLLEDTLKVDMSVPLIDRQTGV